MRFFNSFWSDWWHLMKKYAANAKWKRTCLQDVAWLAKDLCMTSVSLYNLLQVTEWEIAQPGTWNGSSKRSILFKKLKARNNFCDQKRTQCIIFFDTEGSSVFKKFCWRVDRLSSAMKYTKTEIWGLFVHYPWKQKSPLRRDFYRLGN